MQESPRRQTAVRDTAIDPGRYPLILFSHSSGTSEVYVEIIPGIEALHPFGASLRLFKVLRT